jgi:hypothetical protein
MIFLILKNKENSREGVGWDAGFRILVAGAADNEN